MAIGRADNVLTLLKACATERNLHKGSILHAEIVKQGLLQKNPYIGGNLVNMYAKCGALAEAQEVFNELPAQNVTSWNALIAGYAQNGHGQEALNCFEQMELKGIRPDAVTFVCVLKACGSEGAVDKGQQISDKIFRDGFIEKNILVGTALVDMFARCGSLAKAHEVFNQLPARDVVSWSVIIAGYAQHGHGKEALNCYGQMEHEGVSPNAITYVCILKACGNIGAVEKGQQIHAEIAKVGLIEKDIIIGTALVDMYAKCGALAKAHEVFDILRVRSIVSWNALISGYVLHGYNEEAWICYEQMQNKGFSPNAVTFLSMLKACGNVGAADKGEAIHAKIAKEGLLETSIFVGNALVEMYAKCGVMTKAQEVFDKLPVQDGISWSVLIAGYIQQGHDEEALNCFERMQREGLSPNAATLVHILKACGSIGAADKGQKIYAHIVKEGLLEKDIFIGTALVDMYAKSGALTKAQEVFDKLPVQDVVSWSALITGYAQHGHGEEALNCFQQMKYKGHSPDSVTLVCILKACGSIRAADKGQKIHSEIIREVWLENNNEIGNALVDMYAKSGLLAKAQEVFDKLLVRDIVSWSALIAGYAEHGLGEEALKCFDKMRCEGLFPNEVTIVCILKACGCIAAADKGQEIHAEIVSEDLLDNISVGTALVDMYARCGSPAKAQDVFDKLPVQNVVSWNALLASYAQCGKCDTVCRLFNKMSGEGIVPVLVTFTILLNACSHSGLLDKGQMYFAMMSTSYGLIPTLEHYSCMVDLFGRAGHFRKALAMIENIPFSVDLVVWHTVLGACQKWGNLRLGRLAFEHAVELDEKDATAYVCISNIYAATGK